MAHTLTIGKLRGLRQISTEGGIFTMAAEDQRGSMRKMLNPNDPHSVPAAAMTEVKLDIAHALSPLATGGLAALSLRGAFVFDGALAWVAAALLLFATRDLLNRRL